MGGQVLKQAVGHAGLGYMPNCPQHLVLKQALGPPRELREAAGSLREAAGSLREAPGSSGSCRELRELPGALHGGSGKPPAAPANSRELPRAAGNSRELSVGAPGSSRQLPAVPGSSRELPRAAGSSPQVSGAPGSSRKLREGSSRPATCSLQPTAFGLQPSTCRLRFGFELGVLKLAVGHEIVSIITVCSKSRFVNQNHACRSKS